MNAPRVSGPRGQDASDIIFGGEYVELVRYNVCEAIDPSRFRISTAEGDDEWRRVLSFFAYPFQYGHTVRYWIEWGSNPERYRLNNSYAQMKRDISEWEYAQEEFYAFYSHQPGTQQLNVFWAPSPDRYQICRSPVAQLTWSHRFTFYAYLAEKYYILRAISGGVERYRVTTDEPDDVWSYTTSFYGFLALVPGTTKYYISEKEEDGYQVCKISAVQDSAHGWEETGVMCVFDLPVPGTTKYSLYLATKPTRYRIEPENVYCNHRQWQHISDIFAFPGGDQPLTPRWSRTGGGDMPV